MTDYEKPLPQPNADDRPFWEGCQKHELRFQKCSDCGHVRWPAALICPDCYSDETEWITATGKGKVYTFAVYHRAYHPGFAKDLPYVAAVIELEEGPHFLSNIIGCPTSEVRCDIPVEVVWEDINDDFSLPKFKPYKG
jgi:uncharacterized OB-fold protein